MRKSICKAAVFLIAILVSACGADSIKVVKQGTLEKDKTVTVGNALDNYKFISDKKWNEFSDEQERKIVEFIGTFNLDACASVLAENKIGNSDVLKFTNLKMKKIKIEYVVQFAMHQDGKNFELKYSGIKGTKTNGEPFTLDDNSFVYIWNIYQNALPLDVGQALIALEEHFMQEAADQAKTSAVQPLAVVNQTSGDPCANPQTTIELKECEDHKLRIVDAELNSVYRQLQESLTQEGKASLKKEQIAWIKEKETKCKIDPDGGTAAGLIALGCMREMTEERLLKLKQYAK